MERGLPAPFQLDIVDTRVVRSHFSTPVRLNLGEVKRNLKILGRVYRRLRTGQYSVMHLNCSLALTGTLRDLVTVYLARRAKIPYIVHLRGLFAAPITNGLRSRFYRWAYRKMFVNAASILALNIPSYRSVLELGDLADKTQILPNYVNFQSIPERNSKTEKIECLRVIFVGSLIKSKGVDTIVAIASQLPNVRFELIGDADKEYKEQLLDLIQDSGVGHRVHLTGEMTHEKVLCALAASDAFLFPTKHPEGFTNSVAEAMAVGLPIVTSPVGAMPEMIDIPEGGSLISPDNVNGYVEVLSRLFDDPAQIERMGRHNREKARRKYDYPVVVQRLCEIYARVTTGYPSSKS